MCFAKAGNNASVCRSFRAHFYASAGHNCSITAALNKGLVHPMKLSSDIFSHFT